MGSSMAINLKKGGFDVYAYDTNSKTLENLSSNHGINPITKFSDTVGQMEFVVSMLPNTQHVQQTFEENIFPYASPKALLLDSSTISPIAAKNLNETASKKGLTFVDAPVSGGVTAAAGATLTFMVGAPNQEIFERSKIVLSHMGKNIVNCGKPSAGQIAKICNNMALAIQMISVAEANTLGKKLGIDQKVLFEIMRTSSSRCWSVDTYNPVPGIIEGLPASRDYEGGFMCDLMLKDLKLAEESAKEAGAHTPLGKQAKDIYQSLSDQNLGKKDFGVVYREFLKKN
eukprot:CAMPEP_0176434204 /NCGR_PEP_ID=MMETSP0127-20121128/16531_1 /TAXON_ID=938130 /ORGANISM="Platyophrya macrostoma, Strain WH" /LENGTH=285 /DNA_ID=CAMNT_0017816883 /DNA_START=107 /DNA_END=964 /DNA_ORIENTATION=+